MKTILSLFSVVILSSSLASAGVFFESVAGSNKIFRSRAPKAAELKTMVNSGVNTVIIFKNQVNTEVDDEIRGFTKLGVSRKKIYHIPFEWKNIKNEKRACQQVIKALSILSKVEQSAQDKVVFHCTVGEDRTGLLAGLISQLISNETMASGFENQMCAKGYADGNPAKPKNVSDEVIKSLSPIYYKISKLIENGQLTRDNMKDDVCNQMATIESSNQIQGCNN